MSRKLHFPFRIPYASRHAGPRLLRRLRDTAAACFLFLISCFVLAACDAPAPTPGPRILVLGLDGLDYSLVRKMMLKGQLPNLSRLARQGGFAPLETSTPPQSPTAWSNFITGLSPGHHGVFDFIQRDPKTLLPYLSTSRVEPAASFNIGPLAIPLGTGRADLLRRQRPFWWYLSEAGVPATVIKIPAHFPPTGDGRARVLSDMGTPDLLGTYGTFTLMTTDKTYLGRKVGGGRMVRLAQLGEGRHKARLEGPPHPLSSEGTPLALDIELAVDRASAGAVITVGDRRVLLGRGQWSDFVPLEFPVVPGVLSLRGITRLYLKSVSPVTLYISPLNLDPLAPSLPISSPPGFAAELARKAGRYYTQGMPEDTKAMSVGVLSADEFLQQTELVLAQRVRLFDAALADFSRGLLFFYFGSADQVGHMFYRAQDRSHAARAASDEPHAGVLAGVYRALDRQVGKARARLGPNDLLLVISDHGFGPASHLFDLNAWLRQQGYLALRRQVGHEVLGHLDWTRTRAYGLGLNGLYLNLRGREAHGVVSAAAAEVLLQRLTRELLALSHPETGARIVTEVVRPARRYPGPALERAPDLVVGYARGIKLADASAMGTAGGAIFQINRKAWGGDHCGDHRLVPGVLFSSRKLRPGGHALTDLAPSVLGFFKVPVPGSWRGRTVLSKGVDHGKDKD